MCCSVCWRLCEGGLCLLEAVDVPEVVEVSEVVDVPEVMRYVLEGLETLQCRGNTLCAAL